MCQALLCQGPEGAEQKEDRKDSGGPLSHVETVERNWEVWMGKDL